MEQKARFIPFLIEGPVYLIKKDISSDEQVISTQPVPESQAIKKRLIVFCDRADPEDLLFLGKILDAVKLSSTDYHIELNAPDPGLTSDRLLYFGRHPESGATSMYELVKIGGQLILSADPLKPLQSDISRKKLLWNALQQMFAQA